MKFSKNVGSALAAISLAVLMQGCSNAKASGDDVVTVPPKTEPTTGVPTAVKDAVVLIAVDKNGRETVYGPGFTPAETCVEKPTSKREKKCVAFNRKQKLVEVQNTSVIKTIGSPLVLLIKGPSGQNIQICLDENTYLQISCNSVPTN